jgi:hypothetical protein
VSPVRRIARFLTAFALLLLAGFFAHFLPPIISGIDGTIVETIKRDRDKSSLEEIVDAWRESIGKQRPALAVLTPADVYEFATKLSPTFGYRSLWYVGDDQFISDDLYSQIRGFGPSQTPQPLVFNYRGTPLAWAVALVPDPTKLPPNTPILWTRGLRQDGTWREDNPYFGSGGYIAFASGEIHVCHDLRASTPLHRWGTAEPTVDISQALPPGVKWSEFQPAPLVSAQSMALAAENRQGTPWGLLVFLAMVLVLVARSVPVATAQRRSTRIWGCILGVFLAWVFWFGEFHLWSVYRLIYTVP